MAMKSMTVADVAGSPIIGVTRARTRGRTVFTGLSATSATEGFPSIIEDWISERCRYDVRAFTPTATLFGSWQAWARERGIRPGSINRFSIEIASLGFEQFRTRLQRGYYGLVLKPEASLAVAGDIVTDKNVGKLPCILALDLGTTTGWALRNRDGLIASGTVSLRPGRFDGGGMRYLRFSTWLAEINHLSGPVSAIWFEEVRRHAGTDAAHVYGGLMATLTGWAELHAVPYQGVPVGTIKRFATGKGNAGKPCLMAAIRTRGFTPADDNEADAIAILLWAIEIDGGVR